MSKVRTLIGTALATLMLIGHAAFGASTVPLFTGPTGSNPANLPVDLYDLNTLINNVNALPSVVSPTGGFNIIQNPDFAIDQRNEGSAVTITSGSGLLMSVDRWQAQFAASTSGAGNPTVTRATIGSGLNVTPLEAKLTMNSTPSTTVPAALQLIYQQQIEGRDFSTRGFGAAGAQPVTYQFWVKSSVAATLGVYLQNATPNRSYVTTCAASAATWTFCSGTIPGDITGTWNNTAYTVGAIFGITAACGSTFQTTAGAWAGGNYNCTSAQTQVTATASATVEIAAVKLEAGTVATGFISPTGSQIEQLMRFYRKTFSPGTAPAQNAGLAGAFCQDSQAAQPVTAQFMFYPPMFASPTVTTYNPSATNANWRDVTGSADLTVTVDPSTAKGQTGVEMISATAAAAAHNVCIHASFDAGK